jgi:hypothetical protein
MAPIDRQSAQQRVHRILAFRDECAALRGEGRLPLSDADLAAIGAHHDAVIARLAVQFDVDATEMAGQLSRGMRVASFLGAVALTASAYAAVSRHWWRLDEFWQVVLFVALPLAALVGVELSARRERTRYVALLFALAAFGCIWLAIGGVACTLDVVPPPPVLWLGALSTLSLAAGYGFRLIFGGTVLAVILALAASFVWAGGTDWRAGLERLEPIGMAALAVLVMARTLDQAGPGFGAVARGVAGTVFLTTLLLLSSFADLSQLALSPAAVETGYQVLFVVSAIAAIGLGLAWRWTELVTPAAALFTVFLLIRFVDWFWETVPAWSFFLLLAGLAFAWIAALRSVRARFHGGATA